MTPPCGEAARHAPARDSRTAPATPLYVADTIAAIATPPGPGGIGVIRVSGPAVPAMAQAVFERHRPGTWQSHRLYRGRVLAADGAPLDDGLAVLMRAPHSYTGEDVLELHCHGNAVILQRALAALLRAGARAARAGEFTQRAFLNGKLDLAQAEAVLDLVRARTADSAELAAEQLFGRLSRHLAALRERLLRAKAHLEARLDFADEDLQLDDGALRADLASARAETTALLATHARGRLLQQGLRVAVTGQPNAGKSSLLNALLGADRAIVTAEPGTTRDVLEAGVDFDGVPVVLYDTAGLRTTGDEVERIGVARARAVAAAADVVLLVLDSTAPLAPQRALLDEARGAAAGARVVPVMNKIDLACAWPPEDQHALAAEPLVRVSATRPLGLDALRQSVTQCAIPAWADNLPTLTSTRQRDALAAVERSLAHALDGLDGGMPAELVAVDVQSALEHVGAVTGAVTSEDVLDTVFREFCIGK